LLESDIAFAQVTAANGDLFVDLDTTPLRHRKEFQQHRELFVPTGAWRVIRKTEFDARSFRESRTAGAPTPDPPVLDTPRTHRLPANDPWTASYRYVRD
jgi:hypothetical protein